MREPKKDVGKNDKGNLAVWLLRESNRRYGIEDE